MTTQNLQEQIGKYKKMADRSVRQTNTDEHTKLLGK